MELIKSLIKTFTRTACEQYFNFFARDTESFFSWLKTTCEGRPLEFADIQKLTLADMVSFTDIGLKIFDSNGQSLHNVTIIQLDS